ncbi:MAG TPA: polyphosphate polymerase domain-containing protein [Pseudonocardia sp.]|jgi:hypothetical protein
MFTRHRTYSSEDAIRDSAWRPRPISLEDLVESADLQVRMDRKYFVPAATFRTLIDELGPEFTVLEIDGRRTFDYESVYFDTAELLTYRAHLQGRRRRFKVRTRTYLNSGLCMFEVKTEGVRENTVKGRIPHPLTRRGSLTLEAYTFLCQTLREALDHRAPEGLRPVVTNLYRRTTFASPSAGARLTCDVSVSCHSGRASMADTGTHVLVESKSANGASKADLILRRLGVRPASISKYCIGVAALYPEVPCNPWQASLLRYFEPPWLAPPVRDTRSSEPDWAKRPRAALDDAPELCGSSGLRPFVPV